MKLECREALYFCCASYDRSTQSILKICSCHCMRV